MKYDTDKIVWNFENHHTSPQYLNRNISIFSNIPFARENMVETRLTAIWNSMRQYTKHPLFQSEMGGNQIEASKTNTSPMGILSYHWLILLGLWIFYFCQSWFGVTLDSIFIHRKKWRNGWGKEQIEDWFYKKAMSEEGYGLCFNTTKIWKFEIESLLE